ncbi:MAG: hypothetical protein HFE63_10845 [Clostridiales bacterium]|nr:hypothetical protein [Clostridiales bacterium]
MYDDIPDHPTIRCAENTGYAPWQTDGKVCYCPECGEELTIADDVYVNFDGEVIGCSNCLKRCDVSEVFFDE